MHDRHRLPGWTAVAVSGFLFIAHIGLLLHSSPEARLMGTDLITPLTDLMAAGAMLFAAWQLRPISRRMALAWAFMGLGMLFSAGGDTGWMVNELVRGIDPSQSWTEVLYLIFYPLFLTGMLLLPTRRVTFHELVKTTIDILVILLAAALVMWNYILGPMVLANGETDYLVLAFNMAYPIGDLLLLAALIMTLYRGTGSLNLSGRSLWLVGAGVGLMITFDVVFAYLDTAEIYQSGNLVDAFYTLANLLFFLGGAYQALDTRKMPAERETQPDRQVYGENKAYEGLLVFLPYAWVVAAFGVLLARVNTNLPMSMTHTILFVGIVFGLVLLRQLVVVRENRLLSTDLQFALSEVQRQALVLERTNKDMQAEIIERRRAEERLSYDALHDCLTGLPNRALFLDRLGHVARKKKRVAEYQYAVLFLDLDSFKVVNDSLGHVTGDQLLIRTAQILQASVRSTDTVARLGGDEFVILLEEVKDAEDVVITANRLQFELNRPIQLDGTRVFISVSMGIVQNVDEYDQPEDVLRDADLAMYQAKSRGKARYEIFHSGMRASAITRLALENDLRQALENQEFILHYQPILELPDQRLVGFEALVRWKHPERGLVPPAEFIPVAEETGLILPLGQWIMEEACRQACHWLSRFPSSPMLRINVNISGRQLQQPDFVAMVARILKETHLPAQCLALEVTESVCLDNLDTVSETLKALQGLGVETQIDDFGTGYSSLSYLQRLPVRSIKIDRSFIHAMSQGDNSAPDIIRAIFSMVHDLGIKAVAEGIENEAQLAELTRLHCSYVQGFLLGQPMDQMNVEKWVRAKHPWLHKRWVAATGEAVA